MKVSFLIAGTPKGGTTALDAYLRCHPSIGLAARKEVHYFDDEEAFASGTADDERYHAWFTRDDRVRIMARPRLSTCTGTPYRPACIGTTLR